MSGAEIAIMAAVAAETVAEGYAAMQKGKAEQKAHNINAEILRKNAAQKRLETSLNEDVQRRKNRIQMSKLRAAMAENGILESSTTVGALGQAATDLEQDVLNTRYAGETEASNYIQQANYQQYYGKMARLQGKRAFQMSFVKAGINALASYGMSNAFNAATAAGTPAGTGDTGGGLINKILGEGSGYKSYGRIY